jgi:hypothetical protein
MAATVVWVVPILVFGAPTSAQGQATSDTGMQVLTRGPIHEAFAAASMTGAKAGVVVPRTPYDPITELPPDLRPEGKNVDWIPGYWTWDDDRSDFIWLSGVWRDLPPGRQWIPGYWATVQEGSQWISGFWGDAAQTEVNYLPPPPRSLEVGPNSPTPAPDHMWAQGNWVWQQTRYDWQPGYWVVQQPDWVWSPARYTWTPRGYVYVPGFWDYAIENRGVMFAPVYYEQPVYSRPSYSYSPRIVIDILAIVTSLFVQPQSNHYYYGDYYDGRYEQQGIYPWHSRNATRYGNDPMYSHYRSTQLRHDPNWDTHVDEQYQYRRNHVDARPPQTLTLQVNFINTQRAGVPENLIIGKSLAEVVQSKTQPLRFTTVSMDERKHLETRGREVRNLQFERAVKETPPRSASRSKAARKTAQPVTVQFPVSPVVARPVVENVEGAKKPPPLPALPKPQAAEVKDRQVKPEKVKSAEKIPKSQKKPEKAKRNVQELPDGTGEGPLPTKERPEPVDRKPKTSRLESAPDRAAPQSEASEQESAPVKATAKVESNSTKQQQVETRKHEEKEARLAQPRQEPGTTEQEEVQRESAKPGAPTREVSSQELDPPAETPQADSKVRQNKQEPSPNKVDNKNKKGNAK